MLIDTDYPLVMLVRRSQAGDAHALAKLRADLPGMIPWTELDDLARQARESWADAMADGDPVCRVSRLDALDRAAARHARPGAGCLERLLAGRAALAEARLVDLRCLAELLMSQQTDPAVGRDLGRRIKRAERDLAAADRTLRAFQQRLSPGA